MEFEICKTTSYIMCFYYSFSTKLIVILFVTLTNFYAHNNEIERTKTNNIFSFPEKIRFENIMPVNKVA